MDDLHSWPAADLNNILHAHDQLQPYLERNLCEKWNGAVKRILVLTVKRVWRSPLSYLSPLHTLLYTAVCSYCSTPRCRLQANHPSILDPPLPTLAYSRPAPPRIAM